MNRDEAETVVKIIADHFAAGGFDVPFEELLRGLRDHNHEGLREGNWSLAYEGGDLPDEWTYGVGSDSKVRSNLVFAGLDVMLEPRNHVILGIIDLSGD